MNGPAHIRILILLHLIFFFIVSFIYDYRSVFCLTKCVTIFATDSSSPIYQVKLWIESQLDAQGNNHVEESYDARGEQQQRFIRPEWH